MRKKIYFIHIAKTAGSSFNHFLRSSLNGEEHCERYLAENRTAFSRVEHLKQLDYVSGHLRLITFYRNRFDRERYLLTTLLRDPVHQTLSHLNWVAKLSDDTTSPLFLNAPRPFQQLSLKMKQLDLEQHENLDSFLSESSWAFRNNQSRHFCGHPLRVAKVIERLRGFDVVGLTEEYDQFVAQVAHMAGLDVPSRSKVINKNSRYYIPRSVLSDESFVSLVTRYSKIDQHVYRHFKELAAQRADHAA